MIHKIKILKSFADAVMEGDKNFEIRYNDRGYQKGDRICFSVVDDAKTTIVHPLAREVFEITYVLQGWGLKDDYCVFGFKKVQDKN